MRKNLIGFDMSYTQSLLQIVSIPSLWFVPLIALGAILIALIYRMKIKTVKVVTENIRIIQADIKNSVKIFFNKQLRWLLVIIGSLAVLLAIIFAVSNSGIVWFFMIMAYLIGVGAAFLIFWLGIDTGLSANLHAVPGNERKSSKSIASRVYGRVSRRPFELGNHISICLVLILGNGRTRH